MGIRRAWRSAVPSLRSYHTFWALMLIAMLTGCAVGPNFQTPDAPDVTGYLGRGGTSGDAIPGQALARTADIPERWWELFHSRHLNALIEQGIEMP